MFEPRGSSHRFAKVVGLKQLTGRCATGFHQGAHPHPEQSQPLVQRYAFKTLASSLADDSCVSGVQFQSLITGDALEIVKSQFDPNCFAWQEAIENIGQTSTLDRDEKRKVHNTRPTPTGGQISQALVMITKNPP